MTPEEEILWEKLRNRRFENVKFRRQVPMGNYIADFLSYSERLIIEVDGGIHDLPEIEEKEEEREEYLEVRGYRILRVRNEEVQNNLPSVLQKIITALKQR